MIYAISISLKMTDIVYQTNTVTCFLCHEYPPALMLPINIIYNILVHIVTISENDFFWMRKVIVSFIINLFRPQSHSNYDYS